MELQVEILPNSRYWNYEQIGMTGIKGKMYEVEIQACAKNEMDKGRCPQFAVFYP